MPGPLTCFCMRDGQTIHGRPQEGSPHAFLRKDGRSARSRPCRLFLFVSQIRNEGRILSGQTSGVSGCFCPVLNNVVYLSYPLAKFLFRCYDFIKYFLWGALFQERFTEKTCRSSQPSGKHSLRHVPCFILTQERKPMSYTRRGFLKLAGVSLAQPVRFQPRRGPGLCRESQDRRREGSHHDLSVLRCLLSGHRLRARRQARQYGRRP
mgnify:CR=1 FL=1